MRKIVLAGVLVLGLVGCASSTGGGTSATSNLKSTVQIVDFDTAIKAYKQDKNIVHLKSAEKYATTHSQKATLERKMVEYIGVDKVFDVEISHDLSHLQGKSGAGFFTKSRNSSKNNMLTVSINVNKNLPFVLKYNSYKVGMNLQKNTQYKHSLLSYQRYRNGQSPKTTIANKNEIIYKNRNIILAPSNNYSYEKRNIKDNILFYSKRSGLDTYEKFLQSLSYNADLALSKADIIDKKNGLIWQNSFHDTGGVIPTVKAKHGQFVTTCKHLGKGWRLPLKYELDLYSQSKFPGNKLNYWYHREYTYNKAYTKYVRCVKSIAPTIIDNSQKLEWENDVYISLYRKTNDADFPRKGIRRGGAKYCASKGNGWRLPTMQEFTKFYSTGRLFRDNMDLKARKPTYNPSMHYVTTTNNVFFDIEYDVSDDDYIFSANTSNNWGEVKCVRSTK